MTNNPALMRELRRRLDAQAERDKALLAELRELHGQGDGAADGADTINSAIRRVAGREPPPDGDDGEGTGGASSMNDAIRQAAGRPAAPKEEA